jgi:transposase
VGGFSRGGYNRQHENGLDHDFGAKEKLTPFGIFLPETKESFFWMATSRVTADFMIDRLEELLPKLRERCPELETLVINADNGCESSGSRTQWLKRLVDFSRRHGIGIQLAYYPPYHSKYNPVERCWGVLENHWRGEILGSVAKVLGLARSMTYAGIKPVVKLVRRVYLNGVKPSKSEIEKTQSSLHRKPGLEKWFIKIAP